MLDRLKKRRQFMALSRYGKRVVTAGFVVQVLWRHPKKKPLKSNTPPSPLGDSMGIDRTDKQAPASFFLPRIGFTATKKTGNAVERNRIKRRLRALSEKHHLKLKSPHSFDLVLIGRKACLSRPFEKLEKDFFFALHKLNVSEGPQKSTSEKSPSPSKKIHASLSLKAETSAPTPQKKNASKGEDK